MALECKQLVKGNINLFILNLHLFSAKNFYKIGEVPEELEEDKDDQNMSKAKLSMRGLGDVKNNLF